MPFVSIQNLKFQAYKDFFYDLNGVAFSCGSEATPTSATTASLRGS